MPESLYIKNFGPIKEARLEIRDVNVFIGPTSSGKSVAAKLVSIFKSSTFREEPDLETFERLLIEFNISFKLTGSTIIEFNSGEYQWKISKNLIFHNADEISDQLKVLPLIHLLENNFGSFIDYADFFKSILEIQLKKAEKQLIESNASSPVQGLTADEFIKEYFSGKEGFRKLKSLIFDETGLQEVICVPAERILFAMVDSNSFSFLQNESIRLPDFFKEFGSIYQAAREKLYHYQMHSLDVEYKFENGQDFVVMSDRSKVHLRQASSGVQSTVPLELVFKFKEKQKDVLRLYVVEEPEMNLFPTAQKKLIEFMVESVNKAERDQIILTTHSPYVVTAVANLVLAGETGKLKGRKTKVKSIVPESQWLDFDQVSCYQFENGTVKDLRDNEMRTIDGSAIDDVSLEMSSVFHQLLELKYP